MPSDYTQKDTLGQRNFYAKGRYGYMQVAKIPQPQVDIQTDVDLVNYYKRFQEVSIEQSFGDLISEATTQINGQLAYSFVFENYWGDSLEVQENKIVLLDGIMYSAAFAYYEQNLENARKEKDYFFSSLNVIQNRADLSSDQQYEQFGERVGQIVMKIILVVLGLSVVLWLLNKRHYVAMIKNTFAWFFMAWGVVCLLLYFINLISNDNFYRLLMADPISLGIGYVLLIIKVPR
jgi:hypothetical protein